VDKLVVLDSSGWIEWLSGGAGAGNFAPAIKAAEKLIVPSVTILEVVRWSLVHGGDVQAQTVAELMRRGTLADLDAKLAIDAAVLARVHKLPTPDSIVFAIAKRFGAELWTQDPDFAVIAGVRYFPKLA
jgi:toxin FitB